MSLFGHCLPLVLFWIPGKSLRVVISRPISSKLSD
jgi:hypothetical protein